MNTLSDYIEDYLKKLLTLSSGQVLDIQRSELAAKFKCVPSQINYVLSTRFTPERGYIIESRRGGRGYIRIVRIGLLKGTVYENTFSKTNSHEPKVAKDIIKRMMDERLITRREAQIMESVMDDGIFKEVSLSEGEKRLILNCLFRNMFVAIFKDGA